MIELTSEQIAHYRRHGFLVVSDLLTGGEMQASIDHEASGSMSIHVVNQSLATSPAPLTRRC